jgi:hypothetical protein
LQFGISELRCPVDRHEQIELAFLGAHLGDIKMEVADRIGRELLLERFVAFRLWQAADSVALKATMQR